MILIYNKTTTLCHRQSYWFWNRSNCLASIWPPTFILKTGNSTATYHIPMYYDIQSHLSRFYYRCCTLKSLQMEELFWQLDKRLDNLRKFSLTRWGSELYLVLEDLNWCYFNNLSLLFKNRIVIMQNFFDIKSLLKCHYKCTLFKIYKVLQRSTILKSNKFLCFNCIQFLLIASIFFLIIYQLCSYKLFRIIKLYTYTEIKRYSPCRG